MTLLVNIGDPPPNFALRGIPDSVVMRRVVGADLDEDGDTDVVSASWGEDEISWLENDEETQLFHRRLIFGSDKGAPYSVSVADLDSDGDLDVIPTCVGCASV